MAQEITTITTDLAVLKEKIVAFIEMINSKDDWDSIDEIKRNVLESKEVSILILSIVSALLNAAKNKDTFVEDLAQICDDAIKLKGIAELFDKPIFKVGISVGYDAVMENSKFKTISDDVLVKVDQILNVLKNQL